MKYAINWDLESIFAGGSSSESLQQELQQISTKIKEFHQLVDAFTPNTENQVEALTDILAVHEEIQKSFTECGSFIEALNSANIHDQQAKLLTGQLYSNLPAFQLAATILNKKFASYSEEDWQNLMTHFSQIAFRLSEMRRDGQELLDEQSENIINTLALDGQSAWSQHYDTIVASIQIPFNGEMLSAGQAFNTMMSSQDKAVRQELFEKWEKAWSEKADIFADTLNHLDGFRLNNYKLHGVDDFLKQPLEYNRLDKETLDMMWGTIQKNKQPIIDFLTRKAQLFGKDKMDWQDQDAPIVLGDFEERRYTFDQAADFIVENFKKFSPKMSEFAQMAFDKAWIEAEDRPGKRPGGYCTSLPKSQESRIFMTYGESVNEVSTLAHELGHAFHSHVMWDLPTLNQDYAMNVAETASTFAELIVADATLKEAKTDEEKINLLDVKLQNAIAMFMNIHARFIFESNFYAARQKGLVATDEITRLMVEAQKEAYINGLGSYHPHFWAAKLHFFIDEVPFYNFPYTFGYLFSLGIYAKASQHADGFEDQYIALLRDTASMTTEELAKKHLDTDLHQATFWQAGIDMVLKDIATFMELTEKYI
ncbi:M3 family oligoendopeptidase [Enterococcus cecorum]|uniref:Oligoendopeptidase PepF/M3 family protein n=1 Tax=Enterococcus cecorum DSM 20682 = ATCC 43198 TaxID=1121864 RepID=S1RKI8_9ENTE|nr:M3 family oligoendopeptidase [Enterococcus cecorum]EOX18425.1 oligoendopeptidase PepF/M3 family protein [Enterococcus cecorum DSM 20682 = ATCC 43198]ESK60963.1 oligoendopeptidase PepF/M3 family protein [Enterococcus cecorum DSM 20682 = ATCC 43198]CAI3327415.1 M3 family oligoendopeptidase [Enterococcus cecorum]CAI3343087.1 M3 family oligoendopeptidase [Enterococcus cecorum]CAI3364344.1 M3 family oligoendopeptidase [Enterococcus cecorum]